MATLTASSCQTSSGGFFLSPPRYVENGVVARSAAYTYAAAQSAGDVIQMVPIPKGALILDVITNDTSPGGVQYTYTVGDGNSTTRYNAAASASGASGLVVHATRGVGYSYSTDDTIDIGISAITSASAGGTIRLTVFYSFDNAPDGNS